MRMNTYFKKGAITIPSPLQSRTLETRYIYVKILVASALDEEERGHQAALPIFRELHHKLQTLLLCFLLIRQLC